MGSIGPSATRRHPGGRLIIDTDPGIDDVVTLALAARSPELDLIAVTTTYGNATLEATTRNARAILELAGRPDVPVHAGADRPLSRKLVTAPETHGETGVGYAAVPPLSEVRRAGGEEALTSVLRAIDHPITLVTLGPLTNLARALEQDERLVRSRVARHVGMFDTIRAVGNTNRWADFNAWSDPEAVDRVLHAGLPSEMVGLDVTRRMVFSPAEVDRFAKSSEPLVSWLGAALRFYVEFHRTQERLDGCVVNDVLTIGEILDPGLLQLTGMRLAVDLDAGEHRGHTRTAPDGSPVKVAMDVDTKRMRRLLKRVFGDAIDPVPPEIAYIEPRLLRGNP